MPFNLSVSGDFRKLKNAEVHINKQMATKIGNVVYKAFYDLVMRTPQWSGYTAASWNIGFGPAAGSGDDVPGLKKDRKKRPPPYHAGHMPAVGIATMRSYAKVQEYQEGAYTRGELVVWNDSEQIERMYDSDVRPENRAATRAIQDFEGEINAALIEIHLEV